MAIGERIRYFRKRNGLTQRALGQKLGYPEKSADIRMAQYENGSRHPKEKSIEELAQAFGVHPKALKLPDIDSLDGLLHTLFALEDIYGLHIGTVEGEPFLFIDKSENKDAADLRSLMLAWGQMAANLESGLISREEYDCWRYRFDGSNAAPISEKSPSQKFSETLTNAFYSRDKG